MQPEIKQFKNRADFLVERAALEAQDKPVISISKAPEYFSFFTMDRGQALEIKIKDITNPEETRQMIEEMRAIVKERIKTHPEEAGKLKDIDELGDMLAKDFGATTQKADEKKEEQTKMFPDAKTRYSVPLHPRHRRKPQQWEEDEIVAEYKDSKNVKRVLVKHDISSGRLYRILARHHIAVDKRPRQKALIK